MTFLFGPTFVDNPNRKYRDQAPDDGDAPGSGDAKWFDTIENEEVKAAMSSFESQDKLFESIGYTPPATTDFPEDWRNKMVGDLPEDADDDAKEAHEKTLKKLGRFQSPQDVWKAHEEAHKKISSGIQNEPLPENPTDEQLKAYRESNNIPLEAEGYIEKMGDLNIGEEDRPIVDQFLKDFAHPHNLSPEVVKDLIEWQQQSAQSQLAVFDENNTKAEAQTTEELKKEWAGEYDGNINRVNNLLAMGGEEFAARVANASLDDGVSLFNDKATMKFLLKMASEIDPLPASVGGSGASAETVESELREIEKIINTDAYRKNQQKQDRYVELITAYGKLTGKTWGR